MKDITETLTFLQLDVKALREKQSRQSSWEKRENDIGRNKKETQNKIFKCYFCGKPDHAKSRCRKILSQFKAPKSMATKPSLHRIDADKENKSKTKEAVAKLSCGVSEVINIASESGMFIIDVEIYGNIFEFLVDTGATITLISRKVAQDNLVSEGSLDPLKSS